MKSWANTQRNSPGALPSTHPKRRGIFLAFLLSAVACWGATFGAFRGIGEGGTASPRESWSRGKAPAYPEYARGVAPCSPLERALRPAPRVTFVSRRKSPKACQGRCPWTPLGGHYHPPSSAPRCSPQKGEGAIDADGFATLRWCGQLATPSPLALTKRNILLLIRGSAGFWLHVWMQLWGRFGV